jgi:hypothetical protein
MSSDPNMKETYSSDKSIEFKQTMGRYIQEERIFEVMLNFNFQIYDFYSHPKLNNILCLFPVHVTALSQPHSLHSLEYR